MKRKADDGLRKIIRDHLPQVHWVSIETGHTEGGVPDLNGCYRGKDFWIECKATQAYAIKFQTLQIGWHLRRQRSGGTTFVAVRKRVQGQDGLHLYKGDDIVDLKAQGLRMIGALGRWYGGPAMWGWEEFLELLQ